MSLILRIIIGVVLILIGLKIYLHFKKKTDADYLTYEGYGNGIIVIFIGFLLIISVLIEIF